MRLRLLAVAIAAAMLSLLPMPAQATPVGECPPAGGWFAIQDGDIAEIPSDYFASLDFNGDGTLCAKVLPRNESAEGHAPIGILIDNVVEGGAAK